MLKFILAVLFLTYLPGGVSARTIKLGDAITSSSPNQKIHGPFAKETAKSCIENTDCEFFQECVALRCINVCTKDTCITGKYCVPAGEGTPHEYKCVECAVNSHCPKGMQCSADYICEKPDPCKNAVCSPGAPFCINVPYQTLPYTCVQCTNNAHCPPVGGLTRSCVNHFCLFNVAGNIPGQNKVAPQQPSQEQKEPASSGYEGE